MDPKTLTLHGLTFKVHNLPVLDGGFVPLPLFFRAHQQRATQPFAVALHRPGGQVSVYETKLIGEGAFAAADEYYLERLVKTLLCLYGGYRVDLCGQSAHGAAIQQAYTSGGARAFDKTFMERVYKRPFEIRLLPYEQRPTPHETGEKMGGNFSGCRIGFDAGGSDRKVSAVVDGEAIYSEEVEWFPREESDPVYHFAGILSAFQTAAAQMPRVDSIGVSSAGVFVDNQVRISYLFDKVAQQDLPQVEDIFIRAAQALGPHIPLHVINDGEVTALAGALSLHENRIFGVAMGTGEGAGYVDKDGNLTSWMNEPGLAPLNAGKDALCTHWSGEVGCCTEYLCQDGVLFLAARAGIEVTGAYKAARLKEVQALANEGDTRAEQVYRDMGVYLGHALGLYGDYYDIGRVLMLGRVTSGKGGDILLEKATEVLRQDYPHCQFSPEAPDEMARRVGQSVAAASL